MRIFKFRLKIQSAFAGGIGERFNAAVVKISAAVENNRFNTGGFGFFGDGFANRCSLLDLGAVTDAS